MDTSGWYKCLLQGSWEGLKVELHLVWMPWLRFSWHLRFSSVLTLLEAILCVSVLVSVWLSLYLLYVTRFISVVGCMLFQWYPDALSSVFGNQSGAQWITRVITRVIPCIEEEKKDDWLKQFHSQSTSALHTRFLWSVYLSRMRFIKWTSK